MPAQELNWIDMVTKGWSPPYVALVQVMPQNSLSPSQTGAGILLDDWHVLTCLHVLYMIAPGEPTNRFHRDSKNEVLPDFHKQQPCPKIMVRLFHANAPLLNATFVAQDWHHDLAIVKLERAAFGLAPPLEPCAEGTGKAFLCGFLLQDDRYVAALEQFEIAPNRQSSIDGKQFAINYHFGAQGGFSGGPAFSCKDGGVPQFLGIAGLGGDGKPTGQIIAADVIRRFLGDHSIGGNDRGFVENRAAAILGYRPTIKPPPLPDGRALPAFDCVIPEHFRTPPIFVARTPISASAANSALGKTIRAGGDQLPAHLPHRDDVEALLASLRKKTRLPLRLLLADEWNRFQREHCSSGESISPTGRPACLADFETDGVLSPPPNNIGAWLQSKGGPSLYKNGHDGTARPVEMGMGAVLSESPNHERHILRLAFTAGEPA